MEKMSEKKRFSMIARLQSMPHAMRGLKIFIQTTHNMWIHIFFAILAIFLGFILSLSSVEWVLILLAIGLVMVSEAFNTAIEIDINLTSPTYHPYARDTKDVAAGAVLLSSIISLIIGVVIFLPKMIGVFY